MNLPVLVLAGGRGERMRPLTYTVPKCLLPVNGVPFAVRQIDWLMAQGLDNITFSTGYAAAQVQDALANREFWPNISFTFAPDCGIQGAIHQANMSGPFYLLYGDVLPGYDAAKLFKWWKLGGAYRGVMGRTLDYYDTGFSLLEPQMWGIDFIHVPPSLEIGSPAGYAEMRRYFGEEV